MWLNGEQVGAYPHLSNPSGADKQVEDVTLKAGPNEVLVAMDARKGQSWGIFTRFEQ